MKGLKLAKIILCLIVAAICIIGIIGIGRKAIFVDTALLILALVFVVESVIRYKSGEKYFWIYLLLAVILLLTSIDALFGLRAMMRNLFYINGHDLLGNILN